MKETEKNHAIENAKGWYQSIVEMLADYKKAEDSDGDEPTSDEARQTIEESPLSVCVRAGRFVPVGEKLEADEYEILLTTGGPALRIIGNLNQYNQPETARMEWQDWGTPWTLWVDETTTYSQTETTLLEYASFFYFGE